MKSPGLQRLQSEFKDYLFSGRNEIELASSVASANGIDSILRLDVYRNAYYIRLQEALAHDFPVLLAVMGDQAFGREMAAYLQSYPSTTPSLRFIGQYLSQWFYQHNKPGLADLVKLEWAILKAFDAADAERLSGENLLNIGPEQWLRLRFKFHPSLTLLDVGTNVMQLWNAHIRKKSLPAIQNNKPESLVISRTHNGPAVQTITPAHHTFFEVLAENSTFGMACEQLAGLEPQKDVSQFAAQCLKQALSNGWISQMQMDST
ncbi:MAG: hypothetical protein BMS9Abin25_0343 [Gammaproteobacteria bacterium]|nr:MAG: hypothetical protein BMS9Abin25_0343 [Gammaproteobacteria bacterium]